jgi:hypothetical protein
MGYRMEIRNGIFLGLLIDRQLQCPYMLVGDPFANEVRIAESRHEKVIPKSNINQPIRQAVAKVETKCRFRWIGDMEVEQRGRKLENETLGKRIRADSEGREATAGG